MSSLNQQGSNEEEDSNVKNVMEPMIDASDWMDEFNRVKRKLEGFNSQPSGEGDKDTKLNFNDLFDPKSRLNILTGLSKYFSKVIDNKSFNDINKLSLEVDQSLKSISVFEKRISQNAEKKV